jgi:hypothetical protein
MDERDVEFLDVLAQRSIIADSSSGTALVHSEQNDHVRTFAPRQVCEGDIAFGEIPALREVCTRREASRLVASYCYSTNVAMPKSPDC